MTTKISSETSTVRKTPQQDSATDLGLRLFLAFATMELFSKFANNCVIDEF